MCIIRTNLDLQRLMAAFTKDMDVILSAKNDLLAALKPFAESHWHDPSIADNDRAREVYDKYAEK